MPPKCSRCLKPAPGYDRLPPRQWLFVPLWAIAVVFLYTPRRVECPEHGIIVEHIPWSAGKRPLCTAMMIFLARWGRRLSWKETAQIFGTSWEAVYRSVDWFVQWGLAHRVLEGVQSIGVDEIHWGKGLKSANFLTVIYQIDRHCRRLLWVGPKRTMRTLHKGLDALGSTVVAGLCFVCSDMWQPYLAVIKERAGHALHVLDRFHIVSHLNQAVDQVRRGECVRLRGRPKGTSSSTCAGSCCAGAPECAGERGPNWTRWSIANWPRRELGLSRRASGSSGITNAFTGREVFWTCGQSGRCAAAWSQ